MRAPRGGAHKSSDAGLSTSGEGGRGRPSGSIGSVTGARAVSSSLMSWAAVAPPPTNAPSASLVAFAQTVMKMAGANKAGAAKGAGKKGQSATAGKGKGIAKKKKPAKKPAAKKDTRGLEDLDAEMASYQAERSGPAEAPAAEPAAAAVEGAM